MEPKLEHNQAAIERAREFAAMRYCPPVIAAMLRLLATQLEHTHRLAVQGVAP